MHILITHVKHALILIMTKCHDFLRTKPGADIYNCKSATKLSILMGLVPKVALESARGWNGQDAEVESRICPPTTKILSPLEGLSDI